jgi:hypothetical protein
MGSVPRPEAAPCARSACVAPAVPKTRLNAPRNTRFEPFASAHACLRRPLTCAFAPECASPGVWQFRNSASAGGRGCAEATDCRDTPPRPVQAPPVTRLRGNHPGGHLRHRPGQKAPALLSRGLCRERVGHRIRTWNRVGSGASTAGRHLADHLSLFLLCLLYVQRSLAGSPSPQPHHK